MCITGDSKAKHGKKKSIIFKYSVPKKCLLNTHTRKAHGHLDQSDPE